MRFNFILLMNLVAIASIGCRTTNHITLQTNLPQQCHNFDELVKKFYNCDVQIKYSSEFTEDALPYICVLTRNLIVDVCRENSTEMWERFQVHYKSHGNKTICPFNYATKTKNPGVEVNRAADYFRNEENCKKVCYINSRTLDECIVMASLNKLTMSLNEKVEVVTTDISRAFEQTTPQNASKPIGANPKIKSENAAIVQTKAENPSADRNENISKASVKTGTVKKIEEKTHNEKIYAKSEANISEISKGIHTNNANAKSNINVNKDDDGNNNKGNNDNIHNNNENEESEEKVRQNAVSEGKINFTETEMSSLKEFNEPSIYSSSPSKKDFMSGPNIKASSDEVENDGNNELSGGDRDLPENAQLQDMASDRDYDLGRVPNPKELYNGDGLFQAEDSHFSAYFLMTVSIIIIGYIIYHNKNKIVAYALEGRRSRNGRRRPTSASYRKLDCNLEEAIASNPSHASVTNVVY